MKTLRRRVSALCSGWTERIAVAIIAVLIILSLISGLLPIPSFEKGNLAHRLDGPSGSAPFGDDFLGRSILSAMIDGSRNVLLIGLGTVALAAIIGYTIGSLAGYAGGVVDQVIMRGTDILLAFPAIFLALAIVSISGPGLVNAVVAVAVSQVAPFARLSRGLVMAAKSSVYVLNAKSVGIASRLILLRHIRPNVVGPHIVQMSFGIGSAILGVASLGFLGLGAQPPTTDWGTLILQNQLYITQAPHAVVIPGLGIFLVVFAFNVVGEALQRALGTVPMKTSLW